ncbi:MAG: hypothetical protein C1O27_000481 [Chloroflexi bacterium]|jgi:hypothetical protein|nr:MAG: hypothetical protein C1O27_000481 [Chloroflexota bacterium]
MDSNQLKLTVEAMPDGGFRATSSDVPALDVQNATIAGAMEAAQVTVRAIAHEGGSELSPLLKAARTSLLTLKVSIVGA